MKLLLKLLWGLGLLLACWPLQAATQVEVVATWPGSTDVTLAPNQNFYLRFHYHLDAPAHIWARPYFQGEAANAGSHPSRIYAAGEGEALGWFFLSNPEVQVDEVRISVGDGSPRGTQEVSVYPLTLRSSATGIAAQTPPDWVTRLLAVDKAASDAAMQKAMNTPPTAGEMAFFNGFMLTVLALLLLGIGWPLWAAWRWRGYWRALALIPALLMGLVVLNILVGVLIDPTSHNLWPFEIVLWGGLGTGWMLVLSVLRKLLAATLEK